DTAARRENVRLREAVDRRAAAREERLAVVLSRDGALVVEAAGGDDEWIRTRRRDPAADRAVVAGGSDDRDAGEPCRLGERREQIRVIRRSLPGADRQVEHSDAE